MSSTFQFDDTFMDEANLCSNGRTGQLCLNWRLYKYLHVDSL